MLTIPKCSIIIHKSKLLSESSNRDEGGRKESGAHGASSSGHRGARNPHNNGRGGGNSVRGKRKGQNENDSYFPGKKPKANLPHEYMTLRLGNDDSNPLSTNYTSDEIHHPKLNSDSRTNTLPVVIPGPTETDPNFSALRNFPISASFRGDKCGSCKLGGGEHSISESRVFLLGDHLLPPNVGGGGDCVPVGRVDRADFEHIKSFLIAQGRSGFKPAKGTVFAVSLSHHLMVVGNEMWWKHFDDFVWWAVSEFQVQVVPFFMPYPNTLALKYVLRMHQGHSELRGRYLGDFVGGYDWRYCLWKPLTDYLASGNAKKEHHELPPIILKKQGNVVLECGNRVWMGLEGSCDKKVPTSYEQDFIPMILKNISESHPKLGFFTPPTPESLETGYNAGSNLEGDNFEGGPTLYLYGSSIMRKAMPQIVRGANDKGYNVINGCRGSNINTMLKPQNVPVQNHELDTMVLLYLGNVFIERTNFFEKNDMFHYKNPKYMTDAGINKVIDNLHNLLTRVKDTFDGRIVVLGPIPRLLEDCCDNTNHHFTKHPIFLDSLQYCFFYSRFMARHPKLNLDNVFFISYDTYLPRFDEGYLKDGVHLKDKYSDNLATFICTLPKRDITKTPPTVNPNPSWYTWVEGVKNQARVMRANSRVNTKVYLPKIRTTKHPLAAAGASNSAGPSADSAPPAASKQPPETVTLDDDEGDKQQADKAAAPMEQDKHDEDELDHEPENSQDDEDDNMVLWEEIAAAAGDEQVSDTVSLNKV